MSADPGLRPLPPLAKRLNRNALTVAAVLMGITVLTAVVVLTPGREQDRIADTGVVPGGPSRPTFLEEPAQAPAAAGDNTPGLSSPGRVRRVRHTQESGAPYAEPPYGLTSGSIASSREQAFEAALKSPVLTQAQSQQGSPAVQRLPLVSSEDRLFAFADSLGGAARRPPDKSTPAARHREFLTNAVATAGKSVIAQLEPAGSPYILRTGTVMPGVLLTGINSDLPGEIVGQVSRNVYDSRSQQLLLVPKGSKLIGTYDNQVAAGQGRLLIAWTRLILPDGRSMVLPGLPLKDRQGQTGASDKVDHHHNRVFGRAILLSAISAGAQLSQPRQTGILAVPSAGQVAAGALGQELSNVAIETIRRGMDVAPTITIRQGQPFLVFLNGDLVFEGPYQPEP